MTLKRFLHYCSPMGGPPPPPCDWMDSDAERWSFSCCCPEQAVWKEKEKEKQKQNKQKTVQLSVTELLCNVSEFLPWVPTSGMDMATMERRTSIVQSLHLARGDIQFMDNEWYRAHCNIHLHIEVRLCYFLKSYRIRSRYNSATDVIFTNKPFSENISWALLYGGIDRGSVMNWLTHDHPIQSRIFVTFTRIEITFSIPDVGLSDTSEKWILQL